MKRKAKSQRARTESMRSGGAHPKNFRVFFYAPGRLNRFCPRRYRRVKEPDAEQHQKRQEKNESAAPNELHRSEF